MATWCDRLRNNQSFAHNADIRTLLCQSDSVDMCVVIL